MSPSNRSRNIQPICKEWENYEKLKNMCIQEAQLEAEFNSLQVQTENRMENFRMDSGEILNDIQSLFLKCGNCKRPVNVRNQKK